jgi:hypothetical protein
VGVAQKEKLNLWFCFRALKIFAVRYGLLVTFGQYAYADAPPFVPRNPLRTQTKNAVPEIF